MELSVSKKIRFEVFKRDSFTCQYCGAKAPEVVLHADHVIARANGGTDDILNLITACQSCNSGKGKTELSDESVIEKKRLQAELLQARREQIEMIAEWHAGLLELDNEAVSQVERVLSETHSVLNETGRGNVRKWIKKFGLAMILESAQDCMDQYFHREWENYEKVIGMIPRVAYCKQLEAKDPLMARAILYRGILRKKLSYVNYSQVLDILCNLLESCGEHITSNICNQARSWTHFTQLAQAAIAR